MPRRSTETSAPSVAHGRAIVLSVILLTISISLATLWASRDSRLATSLVRFNVTVGLATCLYYGQPWARGFVTTLLILATGISFYVVLSDDMLQPLTVLRILAVGILHGASAFSLLAFPSVGRFLEQQRLTAELPVFLVVLLLPLVLLVLLIVGPPAYSLLVFYDELSRKGWFAAGILLSILLLALAVGAFVYTRAPTATKYISLFTMIIASVMSMAGMWLNYARHQAYRVRAVHNLQKAGTMLQQRRQLIDIDDRPDRELILTEEEERNLYRMVFPEEYEE